MPTITRSPDQLNDTEREVYERNLESSGRRRIPHDDPTVAIAQSLAADGLMDVHIWKGEATLTSNRVLPTYAIHQGDGPVNVDIFVCRPGTSDPTRDRLAQLATLHGANLQVQSRDLLTVWRLDCRHPTATDIEHDSSYLARIELTQLIVSQIGQTSEYVATLADARMWPSGIDITTEADDVDSGTCNGNDHHDPHPFAPYLPPERDLLHSLVGQTAVLHVTPT